ncbi:O-methyltransferase [Formosa algae]|uniref:O-methyltransferase YrrM n=1 Tax=Formosa algae TaxID=225843 RepID=A0A9X0YK12_9FLAO|nr:class I SAM-dependent methyltransferase [Formosa algae]MBP1840510.1 putative O-methyltransferase YrrM [Formosa algae]MDQ0336077.1 putative O-methyltransferase YrrM [Formosa algae]OEI81039.1 methyltransferase [Formosa algae]
MNDLNNLDKPKIHSEIENKSKAIGFTMPSDLYIGTLLKTLITSKPNSNLLELGTGIGLSLSWMIDGMDAESKLTSIDNDPKLIAIVQNYFGQDKRVKIIETDGTEWIKNYKGEKFDLVFADAWPGKYSEVDELLELIHIGGLYIIDDMLPQPNWPNGHQDNVDKLIAYLENRKDFNLTKMNWSTGIIIATKKC